MKGLVRLSGYSTGLKVVRFVLGIGSAALLTWLMPIHDYGVYAYALAIAALLSVPGEAGMPTLVIREISRARVEKDDAKVRGIVAFANLTNLALWAAMAAVTLLVLVLAGNRIPAELRWTLVAILPSLLLGGLANTRAATQRALGSPIASQLPEQIVRPLAVIAFALAAWAILRGHVDSLAGAIGYSLATAVAFAVGGVLLLKTWRAQVGAGPAKFQTRNWLVALAPFSGIAALQMALVQMSMIVLGLFAPPSEVATFRIATLGSDFAMFSTYAISTVVSPQIAALLHRGEKAELQELIGRINRLNVLFALAVVLGILLVGYWALGLVFGPVYRASWLPMLILATGHLCGVSMGFVTTVTNMSGHEKATMVAAGAGTAVNLALSALLCSRYGAIGAATAAAITVVLWRLGLSLYLYRTMGVRSWAFSRTMPVALKRLLRREG
ncbi:MAG: oligosaccharide flippase family protein [Pseudomonadota bacterium]